MRLDGNGDTEGIQAFWCACHKTTIPQNCNYALCAGSPEEGKCVVCADPRGMKCKYDGCCERHMRCQNLVCWKHAQIFRNHDNIVLRVWCNRHTGERPGKNVKPT
eukprot:2693007-Amphidinium_carterae.1